MPTMPKEQSINRQKKGIPRMGPKTRAQEATSRHAIMPNSMTQRVRVPSLGRVQGLLLLLGGAVLGAPFGRRFLADVVHDA